VTDDPAKGHGATGPERGADAGAGAADPTALVDRLASSESIRQLVYRYAVAMDARDLETVAGLFVADVDAGGGAVGRDALRDSFEAMLAAGGMTILNVGNHLIDFDDAGHARGVVYCRAEIESGDEWIVQQILYHDRYERHGGAWQFRARRHLLFYGGDVLRRPNTLPPATGPEYGTGRGTAATAWPTYRAFLDRHPAAGGADRGRPGPGS